MNFGTYFRNVAGGKPYANLPKCIYCTSRAAVGCQDCLAASPNKPVFLSLTKHSFSEPRAAGFASSTNQQLADGRQRRFSEPVLSAALRVASS